MFRATLDYNYAKATYDQDRYAFEAARASGVSGADKMGQTATDEAKRLDELDLAREKAEADKAAVQKDLDSTPVRRRPSPSRSKICSRSRCVSASAST